MKVLIVGGDGRAHTLAWKISQSPKVTNIFCAPGNAGTAKIATNLPIAPTDIVEQVKAAKDLKVDLVAVSPEGPLDMGIVDALQKEGIPAFGPTRSATRIEASKAFAKELMEEYEISHAAGKVFSTFHGAEEHIRLCGNSPLVVKADGLAARKGVVIAQTKAEAIEAIHKAMIVQVFGDAGNQVIIEEFLHGRETSVMVITDGYDIVPVVPACDYKKALDGDKGPNTGGMGSYCPSEFLNQDLIDEIMKKILIRAILAMKREGRKFQGVLYGGLMISDAGLPKVLEFNARFGDPETQVQLPKLKTDLVGIMLAAANGTLHEVKVEWSDEFCVGVVLASAGYPDHYEKNKLITGLDQVDPDVLVFHAGTKIGNVPGEILTDGGRVLTVVAKGKTMKEARDKAYANISRIHFEGCWYRKDIALRAIS